MNKKIIIGIIIAIFIIAGSIFITFLNRSKKIQQSLDSSIYQSDNKEASSVVEKSVEMKYIKLKYTPAAKLPTDVPNENIIEIKKGDYKNNSFFYTVAYVVKINDCADSANADCEGSFVISNNSKKAPGDNLSEDELLLKFNDLDETERYLKDITLGEKYKFVFMIPVTVKNGILYGKFIGLDFLEDKQANYIIMRHENGDNSDVPMSESKCWGKWGKAIFVSEDNKELQYCTCGFLGGLILENEMLRCVRPE